MTEKKTPPLKGAGQAIALVSVLSAFDKLAQAVATCDPKQAAMRISDGQRKKLAADAKFAMIWLGRLAGGEPEAVREDQSSSPKVEA